MLKIQNSSGILLVVIFLSLFFGCTANPFGKDKIISDKSQITGRVILNDRANPEGVYVWLKGYNLVTQTNQNGDFEIRLPPQPNQGTRGSAIEQDTLYFYLANYLIETAEVMISEGKFLYLHGDIDKNGQVRGPIVLRRFLQIRTKVSPQIVQVNYTGNILVETQLQADINCASIGIPKINQVDRRSPDGPLGAIFVKSLDTGKVHIVRYDSSAEGNFMVTVCQNPVIRDLKFDFSNFQFSPGKYEVIPYLLVNPEAVPQKLLEIVSLPFNDLNSNYLHKPIRREDGRLEVRN